MFGISSSEFVILILVAAIVLGPERLPQYAQQLARLIKELRRMAAGATEQVRAELGPEFDDVDWRKLDPRQYDPRRIVREALSDTIDVDDPLGLRDDPLGLKDDPLGLKGYQDDDLTGYQDDKPVSPGGPSSRSASGGRHVAPPNPSLPGGSGAPADVPFDPDAT